MSQKMLALREDLRTAMRSKDVVVRETLRMVIAASKMQELTTDKLTDEDVERVLLHEKKIRVESLDQYLHAGREDIVTQLRLEMAVLDRYLPTQISAEALAERVDAALVRLGAVDIRDMGKVMGVLGTELRGIADLKIVSNLVKLRLSSKS